MAMELAAWIAALQVAQAPPSAVEKPTPAPPSVDELTIIAPKSRQEPDWASRLNFDVHGRYGSSETPYLRQRPTSGCKPMAGGAASKLNQSGAAGGVVCVKRF